MPFFFEYHICKIGRAGYKRIPRLNKKERRHSMKNVKKVVAVVMMMGMLFSAVCMNSMESGVAECGKKEGISVCAEYDPETRLGKS